MSAAVTTLFYAILAWLRPRTALAIILFLIPFGHLVRFTALGIPFTFPEIAVYVLVLAALLRAVISRKSLVDSNLTTKDRQLSTLRNPWIVLPLLWILVAAISATYSPNALRAWGIWKAYFLAPVVLFWAIRWLFWQPFRTSSTSLGNDKCQNPNFKSNLNGSMLNDQHFLLLTSYFLLPLAFGALVVAAIAIVQHWWPIGVPYPWDQPGRFRATSVFGYPNAVGLYLAPLVPLLVGAALSRFSSFRASSEKSHTGAGVSNGVRSLPSSHETTEGRGGSGLGMTLRVTSYFFLLASAIAIVAIAFARSTGAIVALAVALPVLLFSAWRTSQKERNPTDFSDRRNRWGARRGARRAVGIVLVLVFASLLLTAWLPYQRERPKWGPPIVQKLTFQKWSGSVRLAQYRETWALLRDHPIRGAGLAGYQTAIAPYHEDSRVEIFLYPHNLLLAVWVELGLAALLVFLAILYQFFRVVLQSYSPTALQFSVTAALLVILIHGLVDVPYFKNDLAMVFWVIVAVGTIPAVLGTISPYGESVAGGLHSSAPRDR